MNKKEKQKNVFNDLFGAIETIEHKEEVVVENKEVKEETLKTSEEKKVEEVKTTSEQPKKKVERKKRNYYIPVDILESIDKVVYMDRDLKDNTDLVVKALRKYLDSKACRDLLEEYNNLKGNK